MRWTAILAAALFAAPTFAQPVTDKLRTIDVTGHGKVSLPPDTATIHYWLRGEGKTADEATGALAADQTRIEAGLKGFLAGRAEITNSDLVVIEVRGPSCKTEPGRAALSEGDCAIVGYVASSQSDVTTPLIEKAGTAVGLAGRLGARDARLQGFELRDPSAQQLAMTRACADAREQARILAGAAGGHLGRALSIQYGSYRASLFVHGQAVVGAPPPPPPPPPPVEIDMKPRPQEVSADVSVTYELLP